MESQGERLYEDQTAKSAVFGAKVVSIAVWGKSQSLPVSMNEISATEYNLIQENLFLLFADEICNVVSK